MNLPELPPAYRSKSERIGFRGNEYHTYANNGDVLEEFLRRHCEFAEVKCGSSKAYSIVRSSAVQEMPF
jgi:hypothetical protein